MELQNSQNSVIDNELQSDDREITVNVLDENRSPLLHKLRGNYGFFGKASLIFGMIATLLFYQASIGLNSLLFTIITVIILIFVAKKLDRSITKITAFCLLGAILLSLSNVLTSSWSLQFLNSIGILLLLETSLIRLFSSRKSTGLLEDIIKLLALPLKAISSIGMFFVDGNRFVINKKLIKNENFRNIILGCIISIPLLIVIIALLSSADLLFGKIAKSMFEWILIPDFYTIIVMIIIGTIFCYSLLCGATKESTTTAQWTTKANSTIGITISTLLLVLYILFCGIQVIYLFAGGLSRLPVDFTYAEYARRGFFELLTVTCFNIILILICVNVFKENRGLRGVLTAITACTFIMIASAAYRMLLYIDVYYLTFLRLFVLLFLFIDTLLLAGVIISLYNKEFPLFGYSVVVITVCYLTFSFSKPDYHIAQYYVTHTEDIKKEDLSYMTKGLSYDAAPIVVPLLDKQYDYDIQAIKSKYYKRIIDEAYDRDIRDYNYSNDKASKLTL